MLANMKPHSLCSSHDTRLQDERHSTDQTTQLEVITMAHNPEPPMSTFYIVAIFGLKINEQNKNTQMKPYVL